MLFVFFTGRKHNSENAKLTIPNDKIYQSFHTKILQLCTICISRKNIFRVIMMNYVLIFFAFLTNFTGILLCDFELTISHYRIKKGNVMVYIFGT